MSGLIPKLINLIILVWILVYYLRAPLKAMVAERHHTLRDELEKTSALLQGAQAKFQEYSTRLQSLDSEITQLIKEVSFEAENSKVRILTEAKRMSDVIVIDAKKASESLLGEFKNQIRTEFATQVLVRAEAMLRSKLTGDDRVRLVKDFSKQVGAAQ